MNISNNTGALLTRSLAATGEDVRAQTATNGTSATSERDLFLTLLVAQLKNQDPLDPQDGTQFVAQLAQFNTLDQLISIRQILEQQAGNTSGNSAATKAQSEFNSLANYL